MAVILHIPEALRAKLGEDGSRELVALLEQAVRSLKENVSETAAERIERRIAESKAETIKEMSALESRLTWKILAFWATQTAFIVGAIGFATKMILTAVGK
ncbi:MAG: LA_3696 family protein, partial [Desulfotomaculales bacterium]